MTYRALDEAAGGAARWLESLGLGAGDLVAIAQPRSSGLVAACVGAVKAGVAYVCADPASPPRRLTQIVRATGAAALITVDKRTAVGERRASAHSAGPRDLAVVIHTSGTTGEPRAVAIEHRSLVEAVLSDSIDLGPGDRVPLLASVAFDAAAFELWATLCRGATLVVAPDDANVKRFVKQHRITGMLATAALFHTLVDTGLAEVADSLRWLLVGGEELSGTHAARYVRAAPGCALHNCYGPTETTIFATRYRIPADFTDSRVPIGTAVLGKRVYLLDDDLAPGAAGEIYLGGNGLARGYLGAPAATAARFVPDPAGPPGSRMYRTGDLGRRRTDGALDFAGRLDRQAKVSGHRVDPGEVEAVLRGHPAVSQAVVRVLPRPGGRTALCAYVTTAGEVDVSVPVVRDWLTDRLPPYLVPARIVVLDAVPVTPNGKVDHTALPSPWSGRSLDDVAYVPPRTGLEHVLAELWSDVLGVAEVGLDDNFYELGGDSLASVELLARVEAATGVELTARDLVDNQTVGQLCGLVGGERVR